jgi:hypothetical protein
MYYRLSRTPRHFLVAISRRTSRSEKKLVGGGRREMLYDGCWTLQRDLSSRLKSKQWFVIAKQVTVCTCTLCVCYEPRFTYPGDQSHIPTAAGQQTIHTGTNSKLAITEWTKSSLEHFHVIVFFLLGIFPYLQFSSALMVSWSASTTYGRTLWMRNQLVARLLPTQYSTQRRYPKQTSTPQAGHEPAIQCTSAQDPRSHWIGLYSYLQKYLFFSAVSKLSLVAEMHFIKFSTSPGPACSVVA